MLAAQQTKLTAVNPIPQIGGEMNSHRLAMMHGDEVMVIWAMHTRVVRGPDQPSFTLYGHHHDQWERRNGEWKLAALRQTTLHLDVHAAVQIAGSANT